MVKCGVFIVLEGGEGAGKSTQVSLLADKLRECGKEVVVTREVGGAPLAEEIRKLWLCDRDEKWDPLTELLLIFAARREHLVKTITPALERGAWVVSDRYVGSTLAYQGMTMGLGRDRVEQLNKFVADNFQPDLTLLLDLPVELSAQRIKERTLDRYERMDKSFHEKLRDCYLRLATEHIGSWHKIDAALPLETVTADIWQSVQPLLKTSA